MGPRQGPAAHARVDLHRPGSHRFDVARPLLIPQLAHVEVAAAAVGADIGAPAEEDVAGGLHQPLSLDHPPAVVAKAATSGVRLEHRGLCFLGLEEQWVAFVAAGEKDDPGAGPDAADADDLVGQVAELVALQQVGAIPLQGVRVFVQDLADHRFEVVVGGALDLLDGHDERRFADDSELAVDPVGQAGLGPQAVLGARLRGGLLDFLHRLRPLGLERLQHLLGVEARVPDLEIAQFRELADRLAVGARDRLHHRGPVLALEAVVAGGDLEARGEPLEVPLPGPGQRLVEVVEVEDQPPVGGGEDAEVGEVGVAAHLHPQARGRGRGEVGGHHRRGAAVEGERRDRHPPVADRQQLRHPCVRLLFEDLDRVGPVLRGIPPGMAAPGNPGTCLLAASGAL